MVKLKVRMIEGYKSAIAATLKARGMNVGTDPSICGLINRFYRWDLTLVLDAFTKSPI